MYVRWCSLSRVGGRISGRSRGLALVAAGLLLAPGAARANSGGRFGASGKSGRSCDGCHQGGVPPTVTLDGPRALDAGASATYTLRVSLPAGQPLAGMGAAASASDAVLSGDLDAGTRELSGEIVHAIPRGAADAGEDGGPEVAFSFTMQAPPYGEVVTLYAAGNAVNGDRETTGDESARATLEVRVSGPPRPPPAEAGAPREERDAGPAEAAPTPPADGGCRASPGRAGPPALALALGVAFGLRRARRRAR